MRPTSFTRRAFFGLLAVGWLTATGSAFAQSQSKGTLLSAAELSTLIAQVNIATQALEFTIKEFENPTQRALHKKSLETTLEILKKVNSDLNPEVTRKARTDLLIERAFQIQEILGNYVGPREAFNAARLHEHEVRFQVFKPYIYDSLVAKFPFLKGVDQGGVVTLNPGEFRHRHLQSLQTELVATLSEARVLDPSRADVSALAQWAASVEVIHPGSEKSTYGDPLLFRTSNYLMEIDKVCLEKERWKP